MPMIDGGPYADGADYSAAPAPELHDYITLGPYIQHFQEVNIGGAWVVHFTNGLTSAVYRCFNLTPHAVAFENPQGNGPNVAGCIGQIPGVDPFSVPSHGQLRVADSFQPAPGYDRGFPVGSIVYAGVVGWPAVPTDEGPLVLFVSTIASSVVARDLDSGLLALPTGSVVLVPDSGPTAKRDEAGRIVAVTRFILAWGDLSLAHSTAVMGA